MKTKILFLISCLLVFGSFKPIQKTDDDQLYKVIIFKWVKDHKEKELQKVVVIDQTGQIIVNSKKTNKKINIKTFTIAVNNFIKTEKLIKEEANDEPPKMDITPQKGEQYINSTIIKLADFNNEKNFANPSQYSKRKITKSSETNIDLYKYLQVDDLVILKKILD